MNECLQTVGQNFEKNITVYFRMRRFPKFSSLPDEGRFGSPLSGCKVGQSRVKHPEAELERPTK